MGSLKGDTGFVKFNSHINAGGNTVPSNYDWRWNDGAGIRYDFYIPLQVADAPTLPGFPYSSVCFAGHSGAGTVYPGRIRSTNFNASTPLGAWVSGVELRMRCYDITTSAEATLVEAYLYNGGTIGNNIATGEAFQNAYNTGDPLGTITIGGAENLWGLTCLPHKIVNSSAFGTQLRVKLVSAGNYSHSVGFDYIFGRVHWKNTGVMVAM